MSWQLHKHYATASVLQAAPAQRCLRLLYNLFHSAFTSQHPPHTLLSHLTLLLSVSCSPLFDVCNWHFGRVRPQRQKTIVLIMGPDSKADRSLDPTACPPAPPPPPLILFATLRNAVGHVQINGYFSTLCNLQTLSFFSPLLSPSLAYNSYSCAGGVGVFGKVEN